MGTPEPPSWDPLGWAPRTSRISLILQPPLPMRDPHWLAGTTSRRVTGGRLAAVLLVMELLMSCEEEEVLRAQPCRNGTRWGRAWHRHREVTLAPAARAKVTSGLSQSHFPGLPQQHRKNTDIFLGRQQPNSAVSMEMGLGTASKLGSHLSQAGSSAGRDTRDWGELGDSTAPGSARSLPLHQGSRQQLREKQPRRRLQQSCAGRGRGGTRPGLN